MNYSMTSKVNENLVDNDLTEKLSAREVSVNNSDKQFDYSIKTDKFYANKLIQLLKNKKSNPIKREMKRSINS